MTTEWRLKGCVDAEPLHYNWCGLDDVYLRSGYDRVPTDDGDDIVIQDMDGLHRAIALRLATVKKTLNGKEVRFLRHEMDLSQKDLGKILRVTDQTVARWEKGEIMIPGPEELLLRVTYVASLQGHVDVRALAEQLSDVDDCPVDTKQFFAKTDNTWHAEAA